MEEKHPLENQVFDCYAILFDRFHSQAIAAYKEIARRAAALADAPT